MPSTDEDALRAWVQCRQVYIRFSRSSCAESDLPVNCETAPCSNGSPMSALACAWGSSSMLMSSCLAQCSNFESKVRMQGMTDEGDS